MRTLLFFLVLSITISACNNNGTSHRSSYVISKSTETAADVNAVTEQPAD